MERKKMSDEVKNKQANSITQPVRLGSKLNSFHQQVAAGAKQASVLNNTPSVSSFADMSTVVIFPDCSGSMAGDKIEMCREAVKTFLDNCFLGATKVGIATFPELVVIEPTHDLHTVRMRTLELQPIGSTPMHEPLDYAIDEWPLSHGIVISDGSPDDVKSVIEITKRYKDKNIKIDAVHIGEDFGGEDLMKQLAQTTGGIYIKFKDINNFAQNFKFLTPKHRLTLTTSKNPVALLGAAEVKL